MSQLVFVGCNETPDVFALVEAHNAAVLIEPNETVCQRLRERYADNPFIAIIETAIGETETIGWLYHYHHGLSSSLGRVTSQARQVFQVDYGDGVEGEAVAVRTLPSVLKQQKIERIDTLKIDAQGMDAAILMTMRDWLAARRISRITLEVNAAGFQEYEGLPNRESDAINFMDRMPYVLVGRDGPAFQPNLTFQVL